MSEKKTRNFWVIISLVWLILFYSISFIPTINSDQYQNSTLRVSVSVDEPVAMVEISPNDIYLGEITKGYETEYKNITVTNIGTLDTQISIINNGLDEFNYIKLSSGGCSSSWTNISKWASQILSHSKNYSLHNGEIYNFCIKLDLSGYNKTISAPMNLSTNLTIWVMPA